MLGLFAFFYATLHMATYVVLDQFFDPASIAGDLTKRPFIMAGATGFALMVPLAVTSTAGWIRRLGGPALAATAPPGVRERRGRRRPLLLVGEGGRLAALAVRRRPRGAAGGAVGVARLGGTASGAGCAASWGQI